MKKFLLLFLMVFAFFMALAEIVRPTAFYPPTQKDWWRTKNGWESFYWTDHSGHTNTAYRLIGTTSNTVVSASRQEVTAVVDPQLNVLEYTVKSAHLDENFGYDINRVAPATYDLVNGQFYTDMTEDAKTGLWVAYTNQQYQAHLARESRWTAPAKFDISKTPKEYLTELLKGRKWSELIPEEQDALKQEIKVYTDEWQRINDPRGYFGLEYLFKFEWFADDRTEQQKKRSESVGRRGRLRPRGDVTRDDLTVVASSAELMAKRRAAERKAAEEHTKWCREQMVKWDDLD